MRQCAFQPTLSTAFFIFHFYLLFYSDAEKPRFVLLCGTHQGNYVLGFGSTSLTCSSFKSSANVAPIAQLNPTAAHAGAVTAGSDGTAATVAEAAKKRTVANASPAKTAEASLRVKLTMHTHLHHGG
jgi:hypothetical protein